MNELEVSEIQPSSLANVHRVFVGSLSPIKASRKNNKVKYFEGQLSDGRKTVRVISFEPKLRGQMEFRSTIAKVWSRFDELLYKEK